MPLAVCCSDVQLMLFCDNFVLTKKGVPENGWFIMKHPIKIDDLGVPLFLETSNFVLTKKGVETVTVQDGLLSNVVNDWWIGTQPAMFIYKKPTLQKEGT